MWIDQLGGLKDTSYRGGYNASRGNQVNEPEKVLLYWPFTVTVSKSHSAHNYCCRKITAISRLQSPGPFEVLNNRPQEVIRCLPHLHPSLHLPRVLQTADGRFHQQLSPLPLITAALVIASRRRFNLGE